ncbi:MAG TPA: hypothetical protein VFR05_06170, partial [Terriglobia bacterium]|nr:hypothetical protein [Terriglobia bacterium]
EVHLKFGVDTAGFFFSPETTIGGEVSGIAEAGGQFGPFDIDVFGSVEAQPTLSLAPVGQRLYLGELAAGMAAADISLGAIVAEVGISMTAELLDYVDADGIAGNNTIHGGDPFRFIAKATLTGVTGAGAGLAFTWSGIEIVNPDVNEDGQNDFTSAVLVEDMRRLALDVIRGNRTLFSEDLVAAFNEMLAPLTAMGLADALDLAGAVGEFLLENTEVLHVVEFDTIEDFLNFGLPADAEEIIRLKIDFADLILDVVENLAADLGIAPIDLGGIGQLSIQNGLLSASVVFGFDTSSNPFYLLTTPDAISPDDATSLSADFDIVAELDNLSVEDVFEITGVSATLAVGLEVTFAAVPGGKLRIGSGPGGIQVVLDEPLLLIVTADAADLFPNLDVNASIGDDDPGDTTPALTGELNLTTGRFTLNVRKFTATLGDLLVIEAVDVDVTFDPAAPATAELLRIGTAIANLEVLAAGDLVPRVEFNNFGLRQNGKFFLSSAVVRGPPGYTKALGIAGILPLQIETISIDFPDPDDLNVFTLGVVGRFLIDELDALLPFTPVIHVGDPAGIGQPGSGVTTVNPGSNGAFSFDFDIQSLRDGLVVPRNFGPITLGIQGLQVGDIRLDGQVTLGGYQDGIFEDSIDGFLRIISASDPSLVNSVLEILPGSTFQLDEQAVLIDFRAEAALPGDTTIRFRLVVEATILAESPFIRFDRFEPTIESIEIGTFTFQIGD